MTQLAKKTTEEETKQGEAASFAAAKETSSKALAGAE